MVIEFWMSLYSCEFECFVFDGFYNTIATLSTNLQIISKCMDGLMMEAVYEEICIPNGFIDQTIVCYIYSMGKLIMIITIHLMDK